MRLFGRHRAGTGAPQEADRSAPPPAPHVLLCDDNTTVTRVLEAMFEQAGWTVEITESGRECLRALEQRAPDVIVLDQRFYTGLNGLETAQRARDGGFDRPIVLFSAHLDDASRSWAERLRVMPVSKVDIMAVVRHVKAAHSAYHARPARGAVRTVRPATAPPWD